MTLRIQFAITVALAAIVVPILVVQAQSEGESSAAASEETAVGEQAAEATTPQEEAAPAAEPEQEPAAQEDETDEAAATEGDVLGESDVVAEEEGAPNEPTPVVEDIELPITTASSTEATSTPPVEEPKPKEEPLVLQPGVAVSINGNTVSAVITLQNLNCRDCGKELPEVEVLTYYTPWHPNDGPIADYAEANAKSATQARSVADLPVEAMFSSPMPSVT